MSQLLISVLCPFCKWGLKMSILKFFIFSCFQWSNYCKNQLLQWRCGDPLPPIFLQLLRTYWRTCGKGCDFPKNGKCIVKKGQNKRKNWSKIEKIVQKVAKFLTVFEKGTHRVPLHSSDPPFFKGGEVIFNCPPGGGGSENQRKWKYGAGAGLLKKRGWNFSCLIFSKFIIYTFREYFSLYKIVLNAFQ